MKMFDLKEFLCVCIFALIMCPIYANAIQLSDIQQGTNARIDLYSKRYGTNLISSYALTPRAGLNQIDENLNYLTYQPGGTWTNIITGTNEWGTINHVLNPLKKGYKYTYNFYVLKSANFINTIKDLYLCTTYTYTYEQCKKIPITAVSTSSVNIPNKDNSTVYYYEFSVSFDFNEDVQYGRLMMGFTPVANRNIKVFFLGSTLKEEGTITDMNDIKDSLTDSTVDSDAISSLGGTALPTSGPLSAILNIPVQVFQTLIDNLNVNTCRAIEFTIPFVDSDVTIPCFRNLLIQMGADIFYEGIGTIAGGIAVFNYVLYLGLQFKRMQDLEGSDAEFGGL